MNINNCEKNYENLLWKKRKSRYSLWQISASTQTFCAPIESGDSGPTLLLYCLVEISSGLSYQLMPGTVI